jgi:hypothetical protein
MSTRQRRQADPIGARGRTLPDLVCELNDDWRKGLKFLCGLSITVFAVAGTLAAMLVTIQTLTNGSIEEIEPGPLKLRLRQGQVSLANYVAIQSQGWQETGIRVRAGQRLSFVAGGAVNVDLDGLVRRVLLRRQMEDDATLVFELNPRKTGRGSTPEEHYSDTQLELLRDGLANTWLGPEGDATGHWQGRLARRLIPQAPLGALIGQIRDQGAASQPFLVGRLLRDYPASADGTLWLAVNDVAFEPIPELFFADNLGSYLVRVEVR